MNKLLPVFLCFCFFIPAGAISQTYLISSEGTVSTCSGVLYDSGGPAGKYSNNENLTMVFCPADPGYSVRADFSSFRLAGGDELRIFDGATLLGVYTYTTSPGVVISTKGCLRFIFITNAAGVDQGFAASISCIPQFRISDGGTVNTSGAVFYDSGGDAANYGYPENYKITFCSADDSPMQIMFKEFSLGKGATLNVYNGPTTLSIPRTYTSSNPVPASGFSAPNCGCITFEFININPSTASGWTAIVTCATLPVNPTCSNVDFETGSFASWIGRLGHADGTLKCICEPGFASGRQTILTGGTDPEGFPMKAPGGGKYSVRLGNITVGAESEQLTQKFLVSEDNTIYTYQYAVVLEDGGHSRERQAFFRIEMYTQNCDTVTCGQYLVAASEKIPGFINSSVRPVVYKPWSPVSVDLRKYVGDTITVTFTTADCSDGGHYGYAYIDGNYGKMEISASDSMWCPGSAPVTLCVPEGFASYSWSPGGETTRCISVSASGTYTVTLESFTKCVSPTTLSYTVKSCMALRQEGISLSVRRSGLGAQLTWTAESAGADFEIERSSASGFKKIGEAKAVIRGRRQSYTYTDSYALYAEDVLYYRVKSSNAGKSIFSNTVELKPGLSLDESILLVPNPMKAGSDIFLWCYLPEPAEAILNIFDRYGITLVSARASLAGGAVQHPLDLRALSPGIYFVEIQVGGRSEVRKLVVE